MRKYIEPAKTTFDNAERVAVDLLTTQYPALLTKPGSAIRELVVRPMAYLYAWITDNFDNFVRVSSAAYLKTSQETDNEVADAVASNYFITRRQGVYATGIITLQLTTSYIQISNNTSFVVDDVVLVTPYRVIAMAGTTNPGLRDGVMHINMISTGSSGAYMANIPVRAMDAGPIELTAGVPAVPQMQLPSLISAVLSSPVTGGSGTETDAQMMARAEASTANAGIGSYFGIRKRFDNGPVMVRSFGLAGGEDAVLSRARFNNVNVNPGGVVDCYVKTQNQLSINSRTRCTVLPTPYTDDSGVAWLQAEIPQIQEAIGLHGLVCVSGPAYIDGSDSPTTEYWVRYESLTSSADYIGARLGSYQRAFVCFRGSSASYIDVDVMYMPGIYQLQQYIDSPENRFVGQNVVIKSAIPVTLSLSCAVAYANELSKDQLDNIKQAIADYINSTPVGCGRLNFSDIIDYCQTALPGATLRLPCTINASMPLMNGAIDSFFSNTGVLDITTPANSYRWNPSICFFSIVNNNIRIEQL